MGSFYGNVAWGWLCLIPALVMLGFLVMMFVMARHCCRNWMGAWSPGEGKTGGLKVDNQSAQKWKGMQGSMMQSCMEMMGRKMQAATHDKNMQEVFGRWSEDLQRKILDLLDRKGSAGPSEIAQALAIPEDVVVSLLQRLALEGKVRIVSVEKMK